MSAPAPIAPKSRTKWAAAILMGIVASLVLGIVVLAFLWPSKTSAPHNLSVGIAGPETAVTALEDAVGASGTFEFVPADDRAGAVAQIEARETYGAIILGSGADAPEVLTAPAASAAAAQMLNAVAAQLQAKLTKQIAAAGGDPKGVAVKVTSIVPLSDTDPSGAGLAAASFPLAIGGMIGGVLISLLVVGSVRRLAAAGGFALVAGIVVTLIMQPWFEYLQGEFWLNALAMGVTMLATATFIIGCASLLGRGGIALGAIVTVFIGNPLSAAAMPWQFLVAPWGAIGQYMVPGASNALIRNLSYFPHANSAQQWLTLIGWIALGVILTVVGRFRSRPAMHVPEATAETPTPATA